MPNQVTSWIASEIRAEMARQRVTHEALAEALGILQSQMSRRLNGLIEIDADELAGIADRLNVPVTTFIPEHARLAYGDIEPLCGRMPALVAALYVARSGDVDEVVSERAA